MRQSAEEWELITGQRYFKNAFLVHVIDTARGEKSTVVNGNFLWKTVLRHSLEVTFRLVPYV